MLYVLMTIICWVPGDDHLIHQSWKSETLVYQDTCHTMERVIAGTGGSHGVMEVKCGNPIGHETENKF